MKRFKPRTSILPKQQQALWPELAPVKDLGFTLYGGTAVALRLGHRTSVDFDFFTEQKLDKNALRDALPFLAHAEVLQEAPNTLVVSVKPKGFDDPVKLSFFGGLSFGRFGEPELTDDGVLLAASLDDLMATKIKVILQRVELKDYQDLAAMIDAKVDVAKGVAIARQMFRELSPQVALKAMAFHEEKELEGLPAKDKRTLVKASTAVKELPEVNRLSQSLSADLSG